MSDRTGWTRQQWIDDARALVDAGDGDSIGSGHVLALLDEAQELGELRARIRSALPDSDFFAVNVSGRKHDDGTPARRHEYVEPDDGMSW